MIQFFFVLEGLKLHLLCKKLFPEYEGDFVAGLRHGQGTLYYPNGSIYQGQFRFNQATGPGVLQRPDGEQLTGEFKNGHPHGKVMVKLPGKEDQRIEGQFRHGMAHGWIKMFHGNNIVYEGIFRMGNPLSLPSKSTIQDDLIPVDLHFSRLKK